MNVEWICEEGKRPEPLQEVIVQLRSGKVTAGVVNETGQWYAYGPINLKGRLYLGDARIKPPRRWAWFPEGEPESGCGDPTGPKGACGEPYHSVLDVIADYIRDPEVARWVADWAMDSREHTRQVLEHFGARLGGEQR